MKLLMLTKSLAPDFIDGSSLSFKHLIGVARQRHQIRVLTGWRRARAAVPPDAETVDYSAGSFLHQKKRWDQAIRLELKKCPPQVILSNGVAPKGWWPPTAVICGPVEKPNSSLEKMLAFKRRQNLKKAACLLATTPNVGQELIDLGIDSRKIKIIPNALDCSDPKLRERSGQFSKVLIPGHISPSKGQDVLIDAFARLKRRKKDIMLRIVGDVRDRRYLEQLRVQASNHSVQFITDNLDYSNHFHWADVSMLPKHTEGSWSSRAIESMIHGCPIIWAEHPSTRQATGGRGVICEDFTSDSFKAALEKMWLTADKTTAASVSARDYIVSTHDANSVWKRIESALEMLQKTHRWDSASK